MSGNHTKQYRRVSRKTRQATRTAVVEKRIAADVCPDPSAASGYRETQLDEVCHIHGHLLDLSGVELLDITEVPHVTLKPKKRQQKRSTAGAGDDDQLSCKTSVTLATAVPFSTEKSQENRSTIHVCGSVLVFKGGISAVKKHHRLTPPRLIKKKKHSTAQLR